MRRALIGVALVLAVSGAAEMVRADDVMTYVIVCTATRSHLVLANPNRVGGFVQNVGAIHVNVGRPVQRSTIAPVGTFLGVTLHVGSVLELTPGYKGGLECQTAGGTTAIEIYEEM